ncbi:MAG: aspartate kinase [Pseudomonadales bacterium]|nr:aspartate kinase [Pseudomonadales bacterium]
MAVYVQKFGGTSVGSVERILAVAKRIANSVAAGNQVVAVVSAMSGETNRLSALGAELSAAPAAREMDVLLSSGEQVTSALLSMALTDLGIKARSYLGSQIKITTDSSHQKARIEHIDPENLLSDLNNGFVPVVAGFQGVNSDGDITTLGRGGSDTTAVAIAVALQAEECQIFTDVDGVYTADPRMVKDARLLETITFEEMLELASLGSKVLSQRSVEFAGKYATPLRVLSSFSNEFPGTLITNEETSMEKPVVSGITYSRDEAKLTLLGVPDIPGVAAKILGPIGRENIEVDMIVQNVGADGMTDFTFTVKREAYDHALNVLEKIKGELGASMVIGDKTIVKVSVVGVGMRSHAGVATIMFDALAEESINILMISTSEIKISIVIAERYMELAVRSIHKAFGLSDKAVSEA